MGTTDPTGTNGNISVDPLFADVSGTDLTLWDFRLDSTSPLIDAGDPAETDPDGSVADIGAYGGNGADGWIWPASMEEVRTGVWTKGSTVLIEGVVVTGVFANGFTVQDPNASAPEYSGISVFTYWEPTLAHGMEVTLTGQVDDYFGEAKLSVDTSDIWITGVVAEPTPVDITVAEADDEAYEGVLVRIIDGSLDDAAYDCSADGASCADADLWTLSDGSSTPVILYNKLYENDDWADYVGSVPPTGVMTWRWNRRRLMPRTWRDF